MENPMKKKPFAVLAAALLMLALAGCGGKEAPSPATEDTTPESEVTENTVTENTATEGTEDQLPAFTTQDLDGNPVTRELFAGKDLTVVNIWGTFCGPCVGEMPELGRWAGTLPENVQLVGLVMDISGPEDTAHIELAREILANAGADFPNLLPCEDLTELLSGIVGVPTTLFVDAQGKLVGESILGADVEGYKAFVERYLQTVPEEQP